MTRLPIDEAQAAARIAELEAEVGRLRTLIALREAVLIGEGCTAQDLADLDALNAELEMPDAT